MVHPGRLERTHELGSIVLMKELNRVSAIERCDHRNSGECLHTIVIDGDFP